MGLIIPGGGSYVPQELQDRIKQIDPSMSIIPKQQAVMDSGAEGDRQEVKWVWYVVTKWPENDKRWQMVKWGQIDPENAFDVLGQLPPDCPIEQAPGYLAKQLTRRNGTPGRVCDEVEKWNQEQQIRNGAPVSEFAQELFEANKSTLFAKDGVTPPKPTYQYNPPQSGKKNRPKEA